MTEQDLRDKITHLEREMETLRQTLESLAQAWEFEGEMVKAMELRNVVAAQGGDSSS